MKISFALAWTRPGKGLQTGFRLPGSRALFEEYTQRISRYAPLELSSAPSPKRSPSTKLWICERAQRGARQLSSEELSQLLGKAKDSGVSNLEILLGNSDGFSSNELQSLKPDLLWSFGPLTLPHELAAVVAAEQIYRAFSILAAHPYHCGH